MEQQPSNEPLFELQVDYDSGNMFNESSKWAKFIAIVYFVCIGLSVCGLALSSTFLIQTFGTLMPELASAGGLIVGIIITALAIFTYTTILLYRFAMQIKQGVYNRDQATFNSGLKNLKNYFVVYGIFTLLALVLNVIGFIGKLF
jgi:hypothetical protein